MKQAVLGDKAVLYYNVNSPLLESWDYDKTTNYISKRNISYKTGALEQIDPVLNPLKYSIDAYDFFRIEGVQGMFYRDALKAVNDLKAAHGLSFDVKVLSINERTDTILTSDYRCEFEDLDVLLSAWRTEQEMYFGCSSLVLVQFRCG